MIRALKSHILKQNTHWWLIIFFQTRVTIYLLCMIQDIIYHQISWSLDIDTLTVCMCVHECTSAICRYMFKETIRLSTSAKAHWNMKNWKRQTDDISEIYDVINDIHIAIKKSLEYEKNYFNCKSRYSINVQGLASFIYQN